MLKRVKDNKNRSQQHILHKRAVCPRLQDKDSHPSSRRPHWASTGLPVWDRLPNWGKASSGASGTLSLRRGTVTEPGDSKGMDNARRNKAISIPHGPRRMVQHCSSQQPLQSWNRLPGTSCHLLSPPVTRPALPRGGAGHTWPCHPTWCSTPTTFVPKNGLKFCW